MSKNLDGSENLKKDEIVTEIQKTFNNRLNWIMNKIDKVSTTIKADDRKLVMAQQTSVEKMLQEENDRLLEKKKSVDMASDSQNRLITLNENYNKRSMEYLKMMIVVAISLASIAFAKLFHLPTIFVIIISIVTIVFSLFFCISTYIRIRSRDNIYFDEIVLGDVSQRTGTGTGESTGPDAKQTNITTNSSLIKCYGSSCCSSETAWDTSTELCVPKKKINSTIEKMTTQNKNGPCNGCKKTKARKKSNDHSVPYEPSEFDVYTKI